MAAQAVLGLSADGYITQANAEAERMFGYTWDELVGQPLRLLVPDPTPWTFDARQITEIPDGVLVRAGGVRKDGSSFPAGVSLSRMDTDRGILISAAIQDLSLDERLAHAHNLLEGLCRLCSDAVLVTTPDGVIRRWNPGAERLYGYHAEEVTGRPRSLLLAEPQEPAPAPAGRGDQRSEEWRVRKDGTRLRTEVRRCPIANGSGRTTEIVELSRPASSEPGTPAGPPASREVLAGLPLDSLGRMAAGIGHTFNNLLAIISAHASMLAEDLAATGSSEIPTSTWLDDIAHIQRAVARAATQTGQLLTFGRRADSRPVPLDLRTLLNDLAPVLRASLADSVGLDIVCVPDPWPVTADPHQIEQVLRNLTVNASDALPHGGRIHIRAENLPDPDGYFVRLQVHDTGTGIPPEIVSRVFEPFFSTKPAGEAGGMGLAIVQSVVTDAGGQVGVESTPGHGTTVTVRLPAAAPRPDDAAPAEPVPLRGRPRPAPVEPERGAGPQTADRGSICAERDPAGNTGTILVIEDEDDLRGAVRRMLAGTGYEILAANDGMEAIRVAATHPGRVDVLLSDVVMPEMSGPEVADEIRSIRPGVRVVFMSGYDRPFLAARVGLDPGTEVLQKPFSRDALLRALRQILVG